MVHPEATHLSDPMSFRKEELPHLASPIIYLLNSRNSMMF